MKKLGRVIFGSIEMPVLTAVSIGAWVLMLAGCAAGPSRLEADYGASLQSAKVQQVFDPGAESNGVPVTGFDGPSAAATMERYRTTFEKPPPPPTFTIAVGQVK